MDNQEVITTFTKTYQVPEENLEDLQKRIDKLNKRSLKLTGKPIVMQLGEAIWHTEKRADKQCPEQPKDEPMTCQQKHEAGLADEAECTYCTNKDAMYKIIPVTLTGQKPSLGGWQFLGTVTELPGNEGEPLIYIATVPDINVDLEPFRHRKIMCEHCYVNVRRKETYIVQHMVTKQVKQVGSSCLKDFLGHQDPHNIASWAEHLGAFDEYMSTSSGGGIHMPTYFSLSTFLEWVCSSARREGWLSASKAYQEGGISTAQNAWAMWHMGYKLKKDDRWSPDEEDKELTKKIYEWAQTLLDIPEETLNDYLKNLCVIVRSDAVSYKTKGFAASLWIAYKMDQAKLERRAKEAREICNEWYGKVGDRIQMNLEVMLRLPFESAYGVAMFTKFRDADNRTFTWLQSAGSSAQLEEHSTYMIKGIIKEHREWNNKGIIVKETVLKNCKVIKRLQGQQTLEVE